ncbi:ABC transporter substrate-binding protein [Leucobacter sp. UCMA 4100]|uniref:metal ABC transporter solute-binding protein, Zn/Mn family n=1 Tax=Micrococcales TaxID=85006 RepID=UPI0022EA9CCA|nr:zinc ABC transporter substrate-binding protein [Leucobacter sp. UCMA 4100]MDA3147142.1 ABC transporter substrate-binding protein [Leucobacter sp. UCMA 4100]
MATHTRARAGLALLTTATLALLTGCATAPGANGTAPTQEESVTVVASTTWQGMFATAAGAENVTIIVPPSAQHAAEYDPTPSDLTKLTGADFVLYSDFESFVPTLTDAADADAELIAVNADNAPENVIAEVTRLGEAFGTTEEAEAWVAEFKTALDEFRDEIHTALGDHADPVIVSQVYTTWLADLITDDVRSFGPSQPTVREVADLTGAAPRLVLDNIHMTSGRVLPDSDAIQVNVVNYPEKDLDVIALYRLNVDKIIAALGGHTLDEITDGGHGARGESDHGSHGTDNQDHGSDNDNGHDH